MQKWNAICKYNKSSDDIAELIGYLQNDKHPWLFGFNARGKTSTFDSITMRCISLHLVLIISKYIPVIHVG